MSRKKQPKMDDERKEQVINEFVDLYVRGGGRMPSSRMIKKCSYITEEEANLLRRSGELSESQVRKLAEQRTGRKFPSAHERRIQEMRQRCSQTKLNTQNESEAQQTEQKVTEKVGTKLGARNRRTRERSVTEEMALEDLKALAEGLGRVPTLEDIKDRAKYSYSTYYKRLGPKLGWSVLLGFEESKAEAV